MDNLPKQLGATWQEKREETPAHAEPIKYSLTELAQDFHFFNHGALFTYGGLKFPHEDPLNDWHALQPAGTLLVKEPFQAKLFDGLSTLADKSTWDHVICAVRHEDWHNLWTFLCGTAIADREQHKYREVFSGDVSMVDPVLIERFSVFQTPMSRIPVTVFCIDGNDARWEVSAPTLLEPARFVQRPPRAEIIAKAAMVLDGDVSKLAARENQAMNDLMQKVQNAR